MHALRWLVLVGILIELVVLVVNATEQNSKLAENNVHCKYPPHIPSSLFHILCNNPKYAKSSASALLSPALLLR
jgi:hypothetical protein